MAVLLFHQGSEQGVAIKRLNHMESCNLSSFLFTKQLKVSALTGVVHLLIEKNVEGVDTFFICC